MVGPDPGSRVRRAFLEVDLEGPVNLIPEAKKAGWAQHRRRLEGTVYGTFRLEHSNAKPKMTLTKEF